MSPSQQHLAGLAPAPKPPDLTEQQLLDSVLELAKMLGWLRAHFRPARTARGWRTAVQGDGKGFPDIVLVRDRVLFIELKREKGRLAQEQRDWGRALLAAGADYHLWTPADWFDGTIEHVLLQQAERAA